MFEQFFKTKLIKHFFCLILGLILSGCALQKNAEIQAPLTTDPKLLWQEFISKQADILPYNISGSIRFGYQNKTDRASFILWSNGALPLRFDLLAGFNSTIAKIEENEENLIMFLTQENKVLFSENTKGLQSIISVSIPLTFLDISHILRGNFSAVLKNIKLTDITEENTSYLYHFNTSDYFGKIKLNELSLPTEIYLEDLWKMFVEYSTNNLPRKITLISAQDDYKLIIIIKEFKNVPSYTENQLEIDIPKNIPIIYN